MSFIPVRNSMKKWLLATLLCSLAAASAYWLRKPAPVRPAAPRADLPQPCRELVFEGVAYLVCTVNLNEYDLFLKLADPAGKPYGSLSSLADAMSFVFAMNAGMYHEDLSPVGLHVEEGVEHSPLNLSDAPGNFFMKPNGVFYVDREGNAAVMESRAFASSEIKPVLATQSGPMLVVDGKLHPRFEEDGKSRYIRNGVGADGKRLAVFAISLRPVSLGSFGRLFRDALGLKNALFFDGAISALHDGKKYLAGGAHPAGPMLAASPKVLR